MNLLFRRMIISGVTSVAALSAGYLILPYEGEVKDKQGNHIVYKDPVGIPTVCWGQTGKDLYSRPIKMGMKYTESECIEMLKRELVKFENGVDKFVKVDYASDYQKAALISFAYNAGLGNLQSSTLLKTLNSGNHQAACDQLTRWVFSKGKKLPGLERRREEEKQWCLGNVPANVKKDYHSLLAEMASETFEAPSTIEDMSNRK